MHGIRALSVLWVVMGHRRFFHLFLPFTNGNDVNYWLENIRTVIYQTDHLAVDTFFVMGGLLFALSFMRDLEKKQASLWRMYLRRYLRYTPLLAMIIFYQVTLNKFLVSGPTFNWEGSARNCQTNWWAALLHIQNYLDWTRMVSLIDNLYDKKIMKIFQENHQLNKILVLRSVLVSLCRLSVIPNITFLYIWSV